MSRPVAGQVEERTLPEASLTTDGPRLRGVIPYGVESRDLGGWREVMEPGCLRAARMDDLVATVDHAGLPLARYPDTLDMSDGNVGMEWSCEVPESRSDVREAVERKVLRSGSWRMVVKRDEWRGDVRHIHEVAELMDVSVVTRPAYGDARAELRSADPVAPEPEQEATVPDEPTGGGLRVEDRTAQTPQTPEARIMEAIASVPRGEMRDLTHATAAPLEPDDLRTVLIQHFRERSVVAASGVPVIATDKKAVKWPVLTGDVDVAFYDELEQIDESDPALDEFEVPVKALKTLVRMSTEAAEDSDPDLLQLVTDNINLAMVLKGDRELVAGNDPKGFPGLVNIPGTQSIAVDGALSWDHVIRAVGLLVEARVPGPYAVLLGPRPATQLALVKELDNSNAYLQTPASVPPIYHTGWLPLSADADPDKTTTAVVYAPGQQMIVLRRQVTVEIDRSQEFDHDAILARGRYRLGLGVPHPQSIVKLENVDAPPIA